MQRLRFSMERLTSSQIADFNNPLAFARPRTTRAGLNAISDVNTRNPIRTSDIEESFRLVTGAADRLETLEGNLSTMLDLARQGARTRSNPLKLQEIYGKLRSLSAGFDQVVDAIQFNKRTVFDGSSTFLNLGPGVRPMELDLAKLHTYGEDSLNLSQTEASAKVGISYQTEDQILNDGYDIIGLDISDAGFIGASNGGIELDSGNYKLNISYAGANSTVEIRETDGTLIEALTDVDLSGDGSVWADFNVGVRVKFDKESFFSSFDKYDFESNGPAKLQATLAYDRIDTHTLRTGEAPPPDAASLPFSPSLSVNGGSLSASNPTLTSVEAGKTALQSGSYNVNIQYFGEKSIVTLSDGFGRLKAFDYAVDLSASGTKTIDFGVGLSIDVNTDNFNQPGATLSVPVSFNKAAPPLDEFDFREYASAIEDAIAIVQEQRDLIAEAEAKIVEVNNTRNLATTAGIPSVAAFAASGAISLLTGGGEGSLFKPASASSRFTSLSTQLFSTTTALPSQANQSPQQLAALQNTAASNAWLGNFA